MRLAITLRLKSPKEFGEKLEDPNLFWLLIRSTSSPLRGSRVARLIGEGLAVYDDFSGPGWAGLIGAAGPGEQLYAPLWEEPTIDAARERIRSAISKYESYIADMESSSDYYESEAEKERYRRERRRFADRLCSLSHAELILWAAGTCWAHEKLAEERT